MSWTPADYPFALGSGAKKMAESGLAPLVALARGLRSITPSDVRWLLSTRGWAPQSAQARQIKAAVGTTDAMFMPWWTPDLVVQMQRDGVEMPSPAPQLRPGPENASFDDQGRERKYLMIAGNGTVIGPHPSVPSEWLTAGGRPLLFTEGMLKADSALTGMLLAGGVDPSALLVLPGEDIPAARLRLTALLRGLPTTHQVVIHGFISVTTWKNKAEWNGITVRGQQAFVAFDGDVATNVSVYRQARELFKLISNLHGTPALIDLSGFVMPNGKKVGVDDYLAHGFGTWDDLLNLSRPTLPEPESGSDDARPGEWRMNETTWTTQKCLPPVEEGGSPQWIDVYPFIARLAVVEDRRSATDAELASGTYRSRDSATDQDSRVEIEVSWKDAGDKEIRRAIVYGSHEILMAAPVVWRQIAGTAIPSSVAMLPDFPPREPEFTAALKRHRQEDVLIRPLWGHMGWVPQRDGQTPVFIVGEQTIGSEGEMPDAAASGVTNGEVRAAGRFGVQLPEDDDEARRALRAVLDTYAPLDPSRAVWVNPSHAAAFLAAAVRPTVPLPCRVPVVVSGASNSGKTFSSGVTMMFWQREPGTWTDSVVPGNASDTEASSEVSISKTPIWVIDDLAPSSDDPTGHRRSAAGLWRIVRSVANRSSRGRRRADMTAQQVNTPRSLLIVSAEQAPEGDPSIMNRIIHIRVVAGQFLPESREPTTALVDLGASWSPQSIVTGYILRMLARRAAQTGWTQLLDQLRTEMSNHRRDAAEWLGGAGDVTRQTTSVADLALGLSMIEWMAAELGIASEYEERLVSMRMDLWDLTHEGYGQARAGRVGKVFVRALASLLTSHQGHVSSLGSGGLPVPADTPNAGFLNDRLGWTLSGPGGEPRPNGAVVGSLVFDEQGKPCVLFDHTAAFSAVRRHIGGFETNTQGAVWESVRECGLTHPQWPTHQSSYISRYRQGGFSARGVVVPLTALFEEPDEEQ